MAESMEGEAENCSMVGMVEGCRALQRSGVIQTTAHVLGTCPGNAITGSCWLAALATDTVGEGKSEGRVIRAADIHARIGGAWPSVLAQLGIAQDFLRKKPGPCPACGGTDRYTFDNRKGRGNYFCRRCGAGDGFKLLESVHGWTFAEARREVMTVLGLGDDADAIPPARPIHAPVPNAPAVPPRRVLQIRRGLCALSDCVDAMTYLESRKLWPLPDGCVLRAHPAVEYFDDDRKLVGRFPAIVADVRDRADELVTLHITYVPNGRKLDGYEPRKILSPLAGREGCAVRLMPPNAGTLGIAEGIETALSAAAIDGLPVWAALNTSLLAKFDPPADVSELVIYTDRDEGGLSAALSLAVRLQGRVRFRSRAPRAPANDWNDVLTKTGNTNG